MAIWASWYVGISAYLVVVRHAITLAYVNALTKAMPPVRRTDLRHAERYKQLGRSEKS